MPKWNSNYFTMFDGEELDDFLDFLTLHKIEHDCTGTGDVDIDGCAEYDVIVFTHEKSEMDEVYDFLRKM